MNKKALFGFVALLGVLFLFLAAYQANQYWTTKAALAPTLQQLDELAALPSETLSEFFETTSAEVLETKQQVTAATDAILQTVLVDLVLGLLLLFAGLLYYPREG